MVLSIAIVGGLKSITNVDCPWDLIGFGGQNPYVPLFADRPDTLARARCFPGAHASSGFALMCFYFMWRDRSPRLARWALALGIGVGVVFSIGQEARGAHFVSHDLVSAAIVWCVQLALYCWLLRPRKRENVLIELVVVAYCVWFLISRRCRTCARRSLWRCTASCKLSSGLPKNCDKSVLAGRARRRNASVYRCGPRRRTRRQR